MNGSNSRKIKLLEIWDILTQHTDESHPMSTPVLIGLRNIVNFKSRATEVLEFLINNQKVMVIANKVKQMGKYDNFYSHLLSRDFSQAMEWLC